MFLISKDILLFIYISQKVSKYLKNIIPRLKNDIASNNKVSIYSSLYFLKYNQKTKSILC